jgi:hypothetical protein
MTRRLVAALLLVLLTACYSWQPITASPQQLLPEERPPEMRVTSTSGAVFTFEDPSIINDSIAGSTELGPVRMDIQDLRVLEVRRFSVSKTLGAMALNAAAIAGFMALFIKAQPHHDGF